MCTPRNRPLCMCVSEVTVSSVVAAVDLATSTTIVDIKQGARSASGALSLRLRLHGPGGIHGVFSEDQALYIPRETLRTCLFLLICARAMLIWLPKLLLLVL